MMAFHETLYLIFEFGRFDQTHPSNKSKLTDVICGEDKGINTPCFFTKVEPDKRSLGCRVHPMDIVRCIGEWKKAVVGERYQTTA